MKRRIELWWEGVMIRIENDRTYALKAMLGLAVVGALLGIIVAKVI